MNTTNWINTLYPDIPAIMSQAILVINKCTKCYLTCRKKVLLPIWLEQNLRVFSKLQGKQKTIQTSNTSFWKDRWQKSCKILHNISSKDAEYWLRILLDSVVWQFSKNCYSLSGSISIAIFIHKILHLAISIKIRWHITERIKFSNKM